MLRALGVRLQPSGGLPEGAYGPPAPPMMLPARRRPVAPAPAIAPPPPARILDGPFAALSALRR